MNAVTVLCCFLCTLHLVVSDDCSKSSTTELGRLKSHLLCDYDNKVRPKINHSNATTVSVKMVLKYFSYDMHLFSMSVNNWFALSWKDDHLKWNPRDYGAISSIQMTSEEIWVPNFSIYNRVDQSGSANALEGVECLVYSGGTVVCVPPTRHDGLCMADLTRYPFDTQNCTLRYGSWVHTGEEVNFKLAKPPVMMADYTENPEWKLLTVKVALHTGHYNCCPESTFPSIGYDFFIQRHATTAAAAYVIPAVVMVIMTLTTLCLNAENFDRITLACCNLIVHILYLSNLAWCLPDGGLKPPMIMLYSRDSLLLCAFSIVLTVVLRKFINNSKTTPVWVATVVSTVLGSRPGQILFLFESNLKDMASMKSEEDGVDIIENQETTKSGHNKEWLLFSKILDKLCFVAFFVTYFLMFVAFIP